MIHKTVQKTRQLNRRKKGDQNHLTSSLLTRKQYSMNQVTQSKKEHYILQIGALLVVDMLTQKVKVAQNEPI